MQSELTATPSAWSRFWQATGGVAMLPFIAVGLLAARSGRYRYVDRP